MFTYQIYGLCLESNIPLPQLLSCPGGRVDVHFHLNGASHGADLIFPPVAGHNGNPPSFAAYRSSSGYVLRWSDYFDFCISSDGRRITCYPRPGVEAAMVRLALFGRVLSLAMHLQGVPNLHSSAVATPSGAVAFLAAQGKGKSTLATLCALQGHPLVTEEVLALRQVDGKFYVYPGYPQVRLAHDALEFLASYLPQPLKSESDDDKFRLYLGEIKGLFCTEPQPLRAICLLDPSSGPLEGGVRMEEVPPQQALGEIFQNTLNVDLLDREVIARHFGCLADLVARVPVRRLRYPEGLWHLPNVYVAVKDLLLSRASEPCPLL